jgi:hypothetical protein
MTEVKLYKSTLKGLKIFALTIPFVAIGLWMISARSSGYFEYILGWFCICFFGIGILVGLFHTFDRRPQIIINENGIWDRTTNEDAIQWELIKDAYPLDMGGEKFICLVVDDSFIFKVKQYQWASMINQAIGAQQLNLHLGQLNIEADTMTSFIQEMTATPLEARKTVIKKYFSV